MAHRLAEFFRRIIGSRQPALSPEEAERLSAIFRERYQSFRVLLTANGRALETMAEMEQAYSGTRPYGMDFVVSNATAVAVRVYRMIQHLDVLAPDTYSGLVTRFDEIRAELDEVIQPEIHVIDAPLVLPLSESGAPTAASSERRWPTSARSTTSSVSTFHPGLPSPPRLTAVSRPQRPQTRVPSPHPEHRDRPAGRALRPQLPTSATHRHSPGPGRCSRGRVQRSDRDAQRVPR